MAHLPPENIPAFEPFSQRKTLFLPSPGQAGVLVETVNGRQRARNKKFTSPGTALEWCIKHRGNLVFFFNDDPSQN
jgi:hypothetical protein